MSNDLDKRIESIERRLRKSNVFCWLWVCIMILIESYKYIKANDLDPDSLLLVYSILAFINGFILIIVGLKKRKKVFQNE